MYNGTELSQLSTNTPAINDEESLIGPEQPESNLYETLLALITRLLEPTLNGFIASRALFGLVMTTAGGYPEAVPAVARALSRYEMPLVAGPMTLASSLHAAGVESLAVPNRVAMSATSGLSVTNFTLPMLMEIITLIVQALKNEPRTADVQIPNWAAWPVILACLALGILQSIQNDYLITNKADPERIKSTLNRFATHPLIQALSAIVDTASNIHSLIMCSMIAAGVNPEANVEFYTRMGGTFGAGVAGALIFARPDRESRLDAIWTRRLLNVTALTSLSMSFLNTYYLSPNAVDVLGQSVIDEQTALWSTLLALPTLILMLQLLGLKGPALWESITNMANELLQYFRSGPDSVPIETWDMDYSDDEGQRLYPVDSRGYGAVEGLNFVNSSYNTASSSDSESDSQALLLMQHSALFLTERVPGTTVVDSSTHKRSKSL